MQLPVEHAKTWWRRQRKPFSALLALCAGNLPATGEYPSQMPVTGSFDIFFDLCLNKLSRKQSIRQWLETPSRSLWCHGNYLHMLIWQICLTFKNYNLRKYFENVICKRSASEAKLWCFLWSAPEKTVEWTIETPVIRDPIVLIVTSL